MYSPLRMYRGDEKECVPCSPRSRVHQRAPTPHTAPLRPAPPVGHSLGADLFAFPTPDVAVPLPQYTGSGAGMTAGLTLGGTDSEEHESRGWGSSGAGTAAAAAVGPPRYRALMPDPRKLPLGMAPLRAPRSTVPPPPHHTPDYGTPLDRKREALRRALHRYHRAEESKRSVGEPRRPASANGLQAVAPVAPHQRASTARPHSSRQQGRSAEMAQLQPVPPLHAQLLSLAQQDAARQRSLAHRDINPYHYDPSQFAHVNPPRADAPAAYMPYLSPDLRAQERAAQAQALTRDYTPLSSSRKHAAPEAAYFYSADGTLHETVMPPPMDHRDAHFVAQVRQVWEGGEHGGNSVPLDATPVHSQSLPSGAHDPALPNLLGWVQSLHPERMALRAASERWRGRMARRLTQPSPPASHNTHGDHYDYSHSFHHQHPTHPDFPSDGSVSGPGTPSAAAVAAAAAATAASTRVHSRRPTLLLDHQGDVASHAHAHAAPSYHPIPPPHPHATHRLSSALHAPASGPAPSSTARSSTSQQQEHSERATATSAISLANHLLAAHRRTGSSSTRTSTLHSARHSHHAAHAFVAPPVPVQPQPHPTTTQPLSTRFFKDLDVLSPAAAGATSPLPPPPAPSTFYSPLPRMPRAPELELSASSPSSQPTHSTAAGSEVSPHAASTGSHGQRAVAGGGGGEVPSWKASILAAEAREANTRNEQREWRRKHAQLQAQLEMQQQQQQHENDEKDSSTTDTHPPPPEGAQPESVFAASPADPMPPARCPSTASAVVPVAPAAPTPPVSRRPHSSPHSKPKRVPLDVRTLFPPPLDPATFSSTDAATGGASSVRSRSANEPSRRMPLPPPFPQQKATASTLRPASGAASQPVPSPPPPPRPNWAALGDDAKPTAAEARAMQLARARTVQTEGLVVGDDTQGGGAAGATGKQQRPGSEGGDSAAAVAEIRFAQPSQMSPTPSSSQGSRRPSQTALPASASVEATPIENDASPPPAPHSHSRPLSAHTAAMVAAAIALPPSSGCASPRGDGAGVESGFVGVDADPSPPHSNVDEEAAAGASMLPASPSGLVEPQSVSRPASPRVADVAPVASLHSEDDAASSVSASTSVSIPTISAIALAGAPSIAALDNDGHVVPEAESRPSVEGSASGGATMDMDDDDAAVVSLAASVPIASSSSSSPAAPPEHQPAAPVDQLVDLGNEVDASNAAPADPTGGDPSASTSSSAAPSSQPAAASANDEATSSTSSVSGASGASSSASTAAASPPPAVARCSPPPRYRSALPQLDRLTLTEGGMETFLLFERGVPLPHFASFPLLASEGGRRMFSEWGHAAARTALSAGLAHSMDTHTWRLNPDWAAKVGCDNPEAYASTLRDTIQFSVDLRREVLEEHMAAAAASAASSSSSSAPAPIPPIVLCGIVGPRGDGYKIAQVQSVDEARVYHSTQLSLFASSPVDYAAAMTLTYREEAAGVALAAREVGLPIVISFTVETDGRLPSGHTLGEAIAFVEEVSHRYPVYYAVNCAHPTHLPSDLVSGSDAWTQRVKCIRANASRLSHAELDCCSELDAGNPAELGAQMADLVRRMPQLRVIGGCCGTDDRHLSAMARAVTQPETTYSVEGAATANTQDSVAVGENAGPVDPPLLIAAEGEESVGGDVHASPPAEEASLPSAPSACASSDADSLAAGDESTAAAPDSIPAAAAAEDISAAPAAANHEEVSTPTNAEPTDATTTSS